MGGEAQLAKSRAVESGGYHIAGFQVLSAGYDLDVLLSAHVHLTNPQVIGIGVALHGFHPSYDNVADLAAFDFIAFHLGTAHGHGFREGAHGHVVQGDKFFQPFHGKIHLSFTKPFLEYSKGKLGRKSPERRVSICAVG